MSSVRAAVVLTRDAHVALIRRRRAGAEHYLFPGGGVEPYESAIDAAAREAKEELGLDVRIDRLVATVYFNGRTQIFFTAAEAGGRFGTGTGDELVSDEHSAEGSYEPCWIPFAAIDLLDVRPRVVARLVVALEAESQRIPIDVVEAT